MSKIIENKVMEILEELLKLKNIDSYDSLKDHGVNSLNMVYILARVEKEFGVDIPEEELVASNFESVNAIVNLINKLK